MTVAQLSIAGRTVCVDRAVSRGSHPAGAISPVPGAPDWLLGAWAYLGRVVAVVDLARLGAWGQVHRPVRTVHLVEIGKELFALAADADAGDTLVPPPDRSDGLYDDLAGGAVLLEASRLPGEFEAAMVRASR